MTAQFTVFSGPTVLIEYAGLRILTDPTFDLAREYDLGGGMTLAKTAPSPVAPDEIRPIDLVLLSHDQHPDNLDESGREFLQGAPLVVTTRQAADRLGLATATGLAPWESVRAGTAEKPVTVTALPALHGPDGPDTEAVIGQVNGFLLQADGEETVYVSGDNASLEVVREIADRAPRIDTALIFAGAAVSPFFDGAPITLDGEKAAEAARILDPRRVVIAHADSWGHFTDDYENAVVAFEKAGLGDLLVRR